jgi:hypothetical protein
MAATLDPNARTLSTPLPGRVGGPGGPGTVSPFQTPAGTGSGNIAGVGTQAPDVPFTAAKDAMMASLKGVMPKISGDQLDTLLLSVVNKMKDAIDGTEKDKIKTDTEAKRQALQERKAKLEEATKKMEEAEAAKKGGDIWTKIKAVLMASLAVATLVAGALAMLVPGAQPVGVALMVGGGVMLMMSADALYAAFSPEKKGLFASAGEKLAKALGADDEAAGWAGLALNLTVQAVAAVTVIAFAVGASIITGGAAAPVAIAAVMGSIQALVSAGTAVGDGIVAGENYKAAELTSDSKKSEAAGKEQDALAKSIDDLIDMAMARLKGASERFDAMLDTIADNVRDRGETLSRMTFKA